MSLVQRGVADRREHLFERKARGDGLAHGVERQRLAQAQVLGGEALLLEPALHDADDLLDLEGLEDVVVSAALHRVDRRVDGAEPRHDDGQRAGGRGAVGVEELDAPHARHLQVADDEVVVRVAEFLEGGGPILRGADDVAFHPEEIREDVPNELLVVDDKDTGALLGGHGRHRHRHGHEHANIPDPHMSVS